ncbi:lipid kinase [Spirochaetia bacterium]|nr:lipid kinase [Spirochaetia bacterium]
MNLQVKYLFVINPYSFWNKWKIEEVTARIRDYFRAEGFGEKNHSHDEPEGEIFKVAVSRFPRDAEGIIRDYVEELPPETALRVYAVGGDGILFDCLNGIIGLENVELGIIPYGRSNDFIRGFGGQNKSLFRNIALQVEAPSVPMDVIRGGNNYALNFCATGITSLALLYTQRFIENLKKSSRLVRWLTHRFHRYVYWVGGFPAFFNRNVLQQPCEIIIDEERFEGRFRGVLMANGAYYGDGKHPASGAMPNDGLLEVVLARGAGTLRFLYQLPFYMKGRHEKFPGDFIVRRAKRVIIHSGEPVLITLDDQIFFDTSLTVQLLPAAVRFVDVTEQGYQGVISDG